MWKDIVDSYTPMYINFKNNLKTKKNINQYNREITKIFNKKKKKNALPIRIYE